MPLNTKHDKVQWPAMYYIFCEKTGSFLETAPACWKEFLKVLPELMPLYPNKGVASLYKTQPERVYRAGMMTTQKPETLPAGLKSEKFEGGSYIRFILTGSYSQLPEACADVFEIAKKEKFALRDAFIIENYLSDPTTTSEDKLVTEILLPSNS